MAITEHSDCKLYFWKKGGLDLIKQIIQRELFTPDIKEGKHNLFSFMQVILDGDELYQFEAKEAGINRVIIKI